MNPASGKYSWRRKRWYSRTRGSAHTHIHLHTQASTNHLLVQTQSQSNRKQHTLTLKGQVRNTYTHTREEKEPYGVLELSVDIYLATAQSHESYLSAQPCLGIEMFHKLERKNHGSLRIFWERIKIGAGERIQKTNLPWFDISSS